MALRKLAKRTAYITGLAPETCHIRNLAVACNLARRDGEHNLPDFLIFSRFGLLLHTPYPLVVCPVSMLSLSGG